MFITKAMTLEKQKYSVRRLVQGFGINDAPYTVSYLNKETGRRETCPFYRTWASILQRCFDKKHQENYPKHKKATICTEWLSFMEFRSWMSKQDYQKNYLVCDLIYPGNQHYAPATCMYVSSKIRNLLLMAKPNRNNKYSGVSPDKKKNRIYFQITLSDYLKEKRKPKNFITEEAAIKKCREYKQEVLLQEIKNVRDPRVKQVIEKELKELSQKLLPIY